MRVRTLEIRWHGGDPIYACDFQPLPQTAMKKLLAPRIAQKDSSLPSTSSSSLPTPAAVSAVAANASQSFRFATAGADNHVRIWMIHPNMIPPSVVAASTSANQPLPIPPHPRAEYLATLRKHTGAVNVVRFSPNGEQLASAGDDGWIIIWTPTDRPVTTFGVEPEETQYEKEHWKPLITIKSTTREIYDLAWSPNGEYIIAGSTDNTARIYNAADSTCVREITEHNHYVQGVAWDPLNEYLASQSSDRSVHVYGITTKRGSFEAHAVGKNSKLNVKHSRTASAQASSRPNYRRRGSTSDTESIMTSASELREDQYSFSSTYMPTPSSTAATPSVAPVSTPSLNTNQPLPGPTPLTPSASIASTPSAAMFPRPQSRRSSFSGSNAPSPAPSSARNMGRSPSPMPPLPAIRAAPSLTSSWAAATASSTFKLYGDESFTNFFRRLTFSPDGAFLLTPAGQFEDPTVYPSHHKSSSSSRGDDSGTGNGTSKSKKSRSGKRDSATGEKATGSSSKSSVYIYSRANFSRPPVAHLPGHQKASVAVKFSPLLYELRPGVVGPTTLGSGSESEVKKISVERGKDQSVDVDMGGVAKGAVLAAMAKPIPAPPPTPSSASASSDGEKKLPLPLTPVSTPIAMPSVSNMTPATATPSNNNNASPTTTPTTGSVFALPYRMLYAVATQDTVMIYDTQQAGPVCMFTNLHYTSFTDVAWAPDGQSLMLASSDGYCTIVVFDEILPLYHTQQHHLQLQSIAQSHAATVVSPTTLHHSSGSIHGGHSHSLGHSHGHAHSASSSSIVMMTPRSPALSISSNLPPASTTGKRTERSESISSVSGVGLSLSSTPSATNALGVGVDDVGGGSSSAGSGSSAPVTAEAAVVDESGPRAKKKRRIALTHHTDQS